MGAVAITASAAGAQGSQDKGAAGKKTIEILSEYSGQEPFFDMPYRLSDVGMSYVFRLNGDFFDDPKSQNKEVEIGFYKKEQKLPRFMRGDPVGWISEGNFDAFYVYERTNEKPNEYPVAGAYFVSGASAAPFRFERDKRNRLVRTPMHIPESSGAADDMYQLFLAILKEAFSAR